MSTLLIIGYCPSNTQTLNTPISRLYTSHYITPDANTIENIIKYQPVIILIDTTLIEMHNNEKFQCDLISYICRHERTKFIPVLIITFNKIDQNTILRCIKAGALDYINNLYVPEIMLTKMETHVQRYIDMMLLQESVYVDHLTNLYNRRYYEFIITNEWRRTQRDKSSLTMLLIDIDFFKKYNDTYGHLQGDYCLRLVASCLQRSLYRSYDAAIRMGGEEFGIILPNTSRPEAWIISSRIKQSIIELQIPHEHNVSHDKVVTVSIGGFTYNSNINNIKECSELYKRADVALYKAKEMGRNRIHIHDFNK